MNGPFGCPWLTFAAVLVAAASIVAAVVWALSAKLKDAEENPKPE
jgi:hypothetical protein